MLTDKLRATIQEHQLVTNGETVVVGVSGGPDSLALLHALKTLAAELNIKLHVAHLNHQLRGEASDADEQFVLATARAWGLPAANAQWDVRGFAQESGMSLEEAARNLRYQFLLGVATQVKAKTVAVAHNADDQVETILLHFLRGAGLSGLRGMAYKTGIHSTVTGVEVALVRPFLDVPRAEIDAYCVENNLEPRQDESNLDTTILRNRLRHDVIPYLETINPNFREVVRHSGLSLSGEYDYIQQNVLGIFDRMTRASEGAFVFDRKWFRALPVNLQRAVLREAVTRLKRVKNIGFKHIEAARKVAVEKEAGTEATLPQGLLLVVGYDDFTVGEQIPLPNVPLLLNDETITLKVGDEQLLPECDWGVRVVQDDGEFAAKRLGAEDRWDIVLDTEQLRGRLVLRTRRPGERFTPRGMEGKHKSLHEFMIDEKIPRHMREFVPILADEEKILWVVGYRKDERASVLEPSLDLVRVEFFKVE